MTTDPSPSGDSADRPVATDEEGSSAPTLLDQMGGVWGLVYSTIPIVVFVVANAISGLKVAIIAALVSAGVVFVIRLIRREPLQPAFSGLFGVAICVFIAYRTGSAKGFFLFGIWTTLVYAAVFVMSILLRWPLVGVIWNAVNAQGTVWRKHRRTLRAYDYATAVWALLFTLRYIVQSQLYDSDHTGWLAVARIAMGWPLTAVAVLATFLLVRRADRAAVALEREESGEGHADDHRPDRTHRDNGSGVSTEFSDRKNSGA